MLEKWILLLIEEIQSLVEEPRNPIWIVFINIPWHPDELFQLLLSFDALDLQTHWSFPPSETACKDIWLFISKMFDSCFGQRQQLRLSDIQIKNEIFQPIFSPGFDC